MKKYFTDIKKPKWYVIALGLILFASQCMAIISLCYQFGGGYYLIIPLQLFAGYLNVLIYLMLQKDKRRRDFPIFLIISAVLGVISALLIFDDVYTSVPGIEGVFYGLVMQGTIGLVFYALIRTLKKVIFMGKKPLIK